MDRDSIEDSRFDLEELESSPRLGRRAFLIGGLATGAVLSGPVNYAALARGKRIPLAKQVKFPQGIASGFPYPRHHPLDTRRGAEEKRPPEARRRQGPPLQEHGDEKTVTARSDRDFTARVRVNGLRPDHEYFYRFFTEHSHSEVGRFHTGPPLDSKRPLKIAYYSCQEYQPRLLQRPGCDRQREGRRPGPLPRRLHLRVRLRQGGPHRQHRHQPRRPRRDAARSTGRSTGSTRATPT